MGSILKTVKGVLKGVLALDTSTKMKIVSGIALLIGGITVVMASNNTDTALIEGEVPDIDANSIPETEDEIIEIEPEIIEE